MSFRRSAAAVSTRSVSSSEAPRGRSTTTAISDLLSNGSSFTRTLFVAKSAMDRSVARPTAARNHCERLRPCSKRRRDAHIEMAHGAAFMRMIDAVAALLRETLAGDLQQEPWRDGHGDEKREHHRERSVRRNGAHIGAHQTRDEHHRQQRGDDGQRRDDGRIADFGDRLDRRVDQAALAAHLPVAHDVFDDDDGVVDENADREDQREQADAIDRVAHQPRGEEREQNGRRDDDEDDDALAPADHHHDEHDDRHGGEREMEQQLVGLFGRRLAVVARHRDLDIVGDDAALDGLQPMHDLVGDDHGVGALALGDRDADGGALIEVAARALRVMVQLSRSGSAAPTRTSATSLT